MALKRQNTRSSKIGSMKTAVGVRYCLRTPNARVVNIVCDRQRRQKQSAEPLTAQKSHKKPPRATPSHSMPLLSHFSKTKASHHPRIVIGQGLDTIHLHLSLSLSLCSPFPLCSLRSLLRLLLLFWLMPFRSSHFQSRVVPSGLPSCHSVARFCIVFLWFFSVLLGTDCGVVTECRLSCGGVLGPVGLLGSCVGQGELCVVAGLVVDAIFASPDVDSLSC